MLADLLKEKIKISERKYGLVAYRPKQMYGWPGIVKISEKEILVSSSERCFHCCPHGREVVIRSIDGGESWGLPQEVYNSELDDRDANLAVTSDGTLILGWFTSTAFAKFEQWTDRRDRITDKMREELIGSWMCISHDQGYTWSKARRMPVGIHISPVVLSDDSLITIGTYSGNNQSLPVYRSFNLGITWQKTGEVYCQHETEPQLLFNENHVLETTPGKLTAMFRSEPNGDGYLYQSFSEDFGRTWSKPLKTAIWGYPPHLLRLSNGVIMCTYGYRSKPYSIRAVFSYDNGKSWDIANIQILYEWEDSPDMGYPVSVEISPGNILTVFYCSRCGVETETNIRFPQGLMSVKFKLSN